jgi:hypothetical protein
MIRSSHRLEYLRGKPPHTVWWDGAKVYLAFGGLAIAVLMLAGGVGLLPNAAALPGRFASLVEYLYLGLLVAGLLCAIAGNVVGAVATVRWTDGDRRAALWNTAKADLVSSLFAYPILLLFLLVVGSLTPVSVFGLVGGFLLYAFLLIPVICVSFVLSMVTAFLATVLR